MALTLDISTGVVDLGDTKELSVTPKDSDGTAFDPTTLVAVFTPPSGSATTYNKGDFTDTSNVFTVNHTFHVLNEWSIKVTVTDANGNTEVETGKVVVQ